MKENENLVQFIFHIGARTDTSEFDVAIFDKLNLNYTKKMWHACVDYGISLLYASSAATYGLGEQGYEDTHEVVDKLSPLTLWRFQKRFDKWALVQERKPYFWAGINSLMFMGLMNTIKAEWLRWFTILFKQVGETGAMKLFRLHNPKFKDGMQLRDFVYVKDVIDVLYFFLHHRKDSGLYNLGTGKARAFLDLARATFKGMDVIEDTSFIDTPIDIRDKYQYFTQANMSKLKSIGYHKDFYT